LRNGSSSVLEAASVSTPSPSSSLVKKARPAAVATTSKI
jgi:hypothetical protein